MLLGISPELIFCFSPYVPSGSQKRDPILGLDTVDGGEIHFARYRNHGMI